MSAAKISAAFWFEKARIRIAIIPLVKIAVTVAAVAVVGYGLYNLYKTFTGGTVKDILPDPTDIGKK